MPWKANSVSEERVRFVVDVERGDRSMTIVCDAYGISRQTGYKWLDRYGAGGGFSALDDRSRAPARQAGAMGEDTATAIVDLRRLHPHWGPKKLRAWLLRERPQLAWPAASTMGDLLQRRGLTEVGRGQRRATSQTQPFAAITAPHQLWCIDFKGWFRTADGQRCDPLTMTDAHSRYLLCTSIVAPTTAGVWPVCEQLFREHGQPAALRMDNGSPFGSTGAAGLTRLSVRWVKLGIRLEWIMPGCPQHNGRLERTHRTMKQETCLPPSATAAEQQVRFDKFRCEFNTDRPHEALGQRTPASVHIGHGRAYTGRMDDPWYDADHQVRRVMANGEVRWRDGFVYVSEALIGELIGLAELPTGDWVARFADIDLGIIQRNCNEFLRFSAPRPGRAEPENKTRKLSAM